MKSTIVKNIITGISLIILSLMLTNISNAEIDPNTIAGVWLFDEGSGDVVHDLSDNGNDGKIKGAQWTDGKSGKALEFKLGTYVEVPHSKSLDITKALTVTAWIKTAQQGLQTIVGKDDDSGDRRCWHFCTQDGALRFNTWVPAQVQMVATTKVATDEWVFAAATFDGKEMKVYANAVFDKKASQSGELASVDEPVKFGVMDEAHGGGWWYRGLLDEVAIFNVALSESDIKTVMDQGFEGVFAVSPAGKLATNWATIKNQY